jgi:hypothetical protein
MEECAVCKREIEVEEDIPEDVEVFFVCKDCWMVFSEFYWDTDIPPSKDIH